MSISSGSTSLASRLAVTLKAGDVIALSGPLGAGKTTFARALVTRLGGEGEVPSPTFALMQHYETPRLTLTHCDFYRLEPTRARRARSRRCGERGRGDRRVAGARLTLAARGPPRHRHGRDRDAKFAPDRADRTWRLGRRGLRARARCQSSSTHTPYAEAAARYLQGDASTRSYARLRDRRPVGRADEFAAPARRSADPRRQAL